MTTYSLVYLTCILVLGVLLLAAHEQESLDRWSVRWFKGMLVSALLFLIANMISDELEGTSHTTALYITNFLTYLSIDLLVLTFTGYLFGILNKDPEKLPFFRSVCITTLLRVILLVFLFVTGNLFTIENGRFVEQPLSIISYYLSCIVVLELLFIVLKYRSCFSIRQLVVVILYILIPLGSILLEMHTDLYVVTGIAVTISILLVYVLLEAVTIRQGMLRESVLEELSSTDLLTGLGNRRAYYVKLSEIAPLQNVGVLYCDMNSLKETNDHYGHSAGDELIKKFAGLLTKGFEENNVFRISGDEFVVLVPGIAKDLFREKVEDFRKQMKENDFISAVGDAFGAGSCSERLITEAENRMYDDKRKFHDN